MQSENCFTTSDILQDQGLSAQKCFPSSSVGQVCSAIVDRLSRGESICDTEVVDDVSCVGDVVEQLFYRLADESGKLTLTQLKQLINQLPDDHYRVVRQTEDHKDDDDDDENHDDDENDQDVDHHHKDDHDENDHHDHDRDALMNVRNILIFSVICTWLNQYGFNVDWVLILERRLMLNQILNHGEILIVVTVRIENLYAVCCFINKR